MVSAMYIPIRPPIACQIKLVLTLPWRGLSPPSLVCAPPPTCMCLPPGQLTNLVRAVYIPIRPPIACPMKLVFATFKLLSSRTISPEQEQNYFHSIHETSIWSKLGKISSSSDLKCLFLWVSPLLIINQKCASHFRRGTTNENKQQKETKTWEI